MIHSKDYNDYSTYINQKKNNIKWVYQFDSKRKEMMSKVMGKSMGGEEDWNNVGSLLCSQNKM
jgi:hypothetical protein